jgi:putative ABC transport system permease protein
VPAELLRPKAPKAGRRILLERVTFIWKRVKFLHKVSLRNFMRYRQRMLMMVIGIGGCTALLLTGYGIRDSIQDIVSYQYGEISLYQYTVNFTDGQDETAMVDFAQYCGDDVAASQLVYEGSMDMEANGAVKSVYVVAPAQGELEGLMDFHYKGEKVAYPKAGEAIICKNLAESYGLGAGDTITVRDSDMNNLTLTVSGVFENYIYNYVYISADSFTQQWGALPEMKTVLASQAEGTDVHQVAARLLDYDGVGTVSAADDMRSRVDNMMKSLDYIVWLVIVCSGALAFIVLYNLTNININERLREIATIKVLGFYPMESASYVFRENMLLTALGALVGLPLGILLHAYVMGKIRIDLMYFQPRILPVSYLWALLFTFLFAVIVDFFMYFKLERINMAEALKSNE